MVIQIFNFLKTSLTSVFTCMNNCYINLSSNVNISILQLSVILGLYGIIINFILKVMGKEKYGRSRNRD